jgi:hypothetical protein
MNARRVVVSTLAMLWIANGAGAQGFDRRTAPDDRVTAAAFLITFGTTFVVQVYEGRSTTNAIKAGARETNPLIAPFASNGGMLAVSLARATATNVAIRSIGRRHKVAAIAIGAAVNFSYLFIATHNNAVADDMRRQRRHLGAGRP